MACIRKFSDTVVAIVGNEFTLKRLNGIGSGVVSRTVQGVPVAGEHHGKNTEAQALVVTARIARQILVVRGHKIMIDADLAALYGVTTKRFNEQMKRNFARFPADFMFRLSDTEHSALRSQFATSIGGRGDRRDLPYVLTEHGAIMAATILNSPGATEMNVFILHPPIQ